MIYFAAPDGFLVALDAKTGKVRWETKVDNGGQTAGGILVADGKVITNRTCEHGQARELLHRRARREDRQGRSGSSTPPPRRASRAATPGPTCRSSSAPPVRGACPAPTIRNARSLYWGIANPNPYTRLTRHGRHDAVSFTAPSNLYSNSTVALDIDDRQARLVLPGTAGRRLGRRPQPGAHPGAHARQPRSQAREVDRSPSCRATRSATSW